MLKKWIRDCKFLEAEAYSLLLTLNKRSHTQNELFWTPVGGLKSKTYSSHGMKLEDPILPLLSYLLFRTFIIMAYSSNLQE